MGKLQNTVDLCLALAWDMGTSPFRVHKSLRSYFEKKTECREDAYIQAKTEHYLSDDYIFSDEYMQEMEDLNRNKRNEVLIEKNFAPMMYHITLFSVQTCMALVAHLPAHKSATDLSISLVIAGTVFATSDVMMKGLEKGFDGSKQVMDFLKRKVDYPTKEIDYRRHAAYPNFRAALRRIRDGGDGGAPPPSNDDEQRPEV